MSRYRQQIREMGSPSIRIPRNSINPLRNWPGGWLQSLPPGRSGIRTLANIIFQILDILLLLNDEGEKAFVGAGRRERFLGDLNHAEFVGGRRDGFGCGTKEEVGFLDVVYAVDVGGVDSRAEEEVEESFFENWCATRC